MSALGLTTLSRPVLAKPPAPRAGCRHGTTSLSRTRVAFARYRARRIDRHR
jgi:hypothetical protein